MPRLVAPFVAVLFALMPLAAAAGPAAPPRATAGASAIHAAQDELVYVDAEGIERGVVTLEEIEDPFEGYPEDRPPDEDTRYVLLRVAFEATGDAAFDAGPSQLTLRDADGFLWGYASVPREDTTFPELSSQTLAPGNRISGVVGFIVPAEAELAEIYYQPESGRLIVLADLAQGAGGDEEEDEEEAEDEEAEDGAEEEEEEEEETQDDADDEEEESASGVDGNTYTSPTYGYTLEWDADVWEVFDAGIRDDGTDYLQLVNSETFGSLAIYGEASHDGDPVQCVDALTDELGDAAFVESELEPLEGEDGEVVAGEDNDRAFAAFTYTGTLDGEEEEFVAYTECRKLVPGEAVLIIAQTSRAGSYEEDAEAAQEVLDTLELADEEADSSAEDVADGEAEDDADGEAEDEAAAAGERSAVLESPTQGFALAYDPAEWEPVDVGDDDLMAVSNGQSTVLLWGTRNFDEAEMPDCVEDRRAANEEQVPDLAPLDEPDAAGEEEGRAWGTYGFVAEFDDGEEDWVLYIECRWLGDGLTLVIYHDAPASAYQDEVEAREELLVGLEAPETAAEDGEVDEGESASGVEGNNYTSPTYGYAITWDDRVWTVGEAGSDEEGDLLRLDLPGNEGWVYLQGFAFAGDAESCLDAHVEERVNSPSWRDYGPAVDLSAPEGPENPGAAGVFAGTFTDSTGQEFELVQYVACWILPEEEAALQVTFEALSPSSYELYRQVVGKLLAELRLP